MPTCKFAALSGGLLAAATVLAAAAPATLRNDVVVHAGPGANFTVIGHLRSGARLELTDCTAQWCRVEFDGIAGFVGAADLVVGADVRRPAPSTAESPQRRARVTRKPAPAGSSRRSLPPGEDSDLRVDPASHP